MLQILRHQRSLVFWRKEPIVTRPMLIRLGVRLSLRLMWHRCICHFTLSRYRQATAVCSAGLGLHPGLPVDTTMCIIRQFVLFKVMLQFRKLSNDNLHLFFFYSRSFGLQYCPTLHLCVKPFYSFRFNSQLKVPFWFFSSSTQIDISHNTYKISSYHLFRPFR